MRTNVIILLTGLADYGKMFSVVTNDLGASEMHKPSYHIHWNNQPQPDATPWSSAKNAFDNAERTKQRGEHYSIVEIGEHGWPHDFRTIDLEQLHRDRKNAARRAKHQAYLDCGMKRVRGALGGVYYE